MFLLLKALPLHPQRCFIKRGPRVRLTEAVTSEFIAQHTTIPVPRVMDVFIYDGTVHIVQEFIDASLLWTVWRGLGREDRVKCMIQLKGYIDQLRSLIPPEPGKVQSIRGEGFLDSRLRSQEWGPFDSQEAFIDFLQYDNVRAQPDRFPRTQEPLSQVKGRTYRTVFTHGDIGPHNILWDMNKREIAAIIDWEFSGWFPEFWEYTRAYFGPAPLRKGYGWWEMFQDYTDCYTDELNVEITISDYLGINF